MIGQSELPMMKNLTGSKEKTSEEAKAKPTPDEAKAFEKALLSEARAFAEAKDLKTADVERLATLAPVKRSPSVDVKSAEKAEPQAQTNVSSIDPTRVGEVSPSEPDEPRLMISKSQTSEVSDTDVQQLSGETSSGMRDPSMGVSNAQSDASSDKPQPTTEPSQVSKLPDLQPEMPDRRDASRDEAPEALIAQEKPPASISTTDRSAVNEVTEQLVVQANEADDSTLPLAKTETSGGSVREVRTSEQPVTVNEGQPLQTRAGPEEYQIVEETADAAFVGVSKTPNPIAESDQVDIPFVVGASSAIAPAKVAYPSRIQSLQVPPKSSQSLGESRVNLASTTASTPPDLVPAPTNNLSSTNDQKALYSTASTASSLAQTTVPEMSVQKTGAPNERLDVSLGSATSVTSSASSRAEAPIQTATPTPVESKQVVQQINQAIIRMDGARTEVMLDPVELGRVSLTFITKDEGVTVLITADRSETADLLRRNGEQLQRDLSESGYEGVELEFDQGDDAHQDRSKADGFKDATSTQSISISYDVSSIASGLDIRI